MLPAINLLNPLSIMDKSSRQNKETLDLNNNIDQMDLTDIEHSIQLEQNTHSSQVYMEQFLE